MHTFTDSASRFFAPAFFTGLWLSLIKELLSEILHVHAVLYTGKTGSVEIKLDSMIINYFFFGQATRTYRAHRAGF
jgi:hypothetical protein